MFTLSTLLTLLLSTMAQIESNSREWTDRTGSFKIDAALAGIEGVSVKLKESKNGGVVTVPISVLSAADQRFLEGLELKRLAGKWVIDETSLDGLALDIGAGDLVIEGNSFRWKYLKGEKSGLVSVSLTKVPRWISFDIKKGVPKPGLTPGIYLMEGDVLTISTEITGEKRPTKLGEIPNTVTWKYRRAK